MTPALEITLIHSACAGDRNAYAALVEHYKTMVYGLAYHRLQNFEDARDAAQDAFVSAFLNLDQLADTAKFAPWLRRITVNACAAFRRRSPNVLPLDMTLAAPDRVDQLLSELVVQQALTCLTDETRLTLTLYYFKSYSIAEISCFLDVPATAIKSRLRDGRARLKKEMILMVEHNMRHAALAADLSGHTNESAASSSGQNNELAASFSERVNEFSNAATTGNTDTVRNFLDTDASLVNSRGTVDQADLAQMRGHKAHDGWSPLHLAAHYGRIETVRLLLEYGADAEAVSQNSIGNTPISAAAWGNHMDIVTLLLDSGARIDAPNAWGSTALHRAAQAGRAPMAELLLSRGADHTLKDGEGRTPLAIVRQGDNQELIGLLSRYGAFE